jgi:hypothetical protein
MNPSCLIHAGYSHASAQGATIGTLNDLSGNGRSFTQATEGNKPTASTLNGKPSIRFTGASDQYMSSTALISSFMSASTGTCIAVFNAISVATDSATPSSNDSIWGTATSARMIHSLRSSGQVMTMNYDGSEDTISKAMTVGVTTMSIWKHGSSLMYGETETVAETYTASGNTDVMTYVVNLGAGANVANTLDGHLLLIVWFPTVLTAGQLGRLKQAIGAEFQLNMANP